MLSQPFTGNGRISVYHAAGLSMLPLRPTCFPRYFLHLGYGGAYALRNSLPLNGVTSMSFRPGCHRPFRRSCCLGSLPLLFLDCVLVCLISVFLFLHPRTIASASSSLQPPSLTDPSPCLYTAGAYSCFCGRRGIRTLKACYGLSTRPSFQCAAML